MVLHGIGASPGIGIGRAVVLRAPGLDYSGVRPAGAQRERERLARAVEDFRTKTRRMAEEIRGRVGEQEAEILSGQLMMLEDPFLTGQMEEAVAGGACAEAAVDRVCEGFAQLFAGAEDELIRQRATDVGDMRARLLALLLGVEEIDLSALAPGTVLVAGDLTPSMTVGLRQDHIAGILTETGGKTSHSAILARALGIPAVLSIPGVTRRLAGGEWVVVDGGGEAHIGPDERTLERFRALQAEQRARQALLLQYRDRPTVDADGGRVLLCANIGSQAEARAALAAGAEGVGLFRTEFLFMGRERMPDEEEQYAAYRAVCDEMGEREVIIRTLDVGGDKAVPYLNMEPEENPFLGHRAIRYCLDRPSLFKVQLRALLRAGAQRRNIKIMLPLVTGPEEVRQARSLLEACAGELEAACVPYDRNIRLGVMIETPAAALTADLLAREADFFSIGTNDLTQYTMAVDRGNARVERLYTPFHPAVLRSIRGVIRAGRQAGIPVGMCGETASDPRMIPLLLSFGLDEFSVSPSAVLSTRAAIAGWRRKDADALTARVMELRTAAQVMEAVSGQA